ncbi:MAG: 16S rRNA (guanine(966)-N(2))-methyltransferase RsmD [Anaerostipes sp.]|nr:16S rRNA (guanine(966)-N(2))-methyltransferase RsmD [Anaerostipes sp.]
MRVISGKARSLRLKTLEGMDTRPTQDRIKETLFNMIQHEVAGKSFLDLFAGSGAIGIEALSRGCGHAVFVENNKKAAGCIRENLIHTKLAENAQVLVTDVLSALRKLETEGRTFDYIFMDPPYNKGMEEAVLRELDHSSVCGEQTFVIVESSLQTELEDRMFDHLKICKIKEYKTNKHTFLQKLQED